MEVPIHRSAEVAKRFLESFDGSAVQLFRNFLALHPNIPKWMIAADFALDSSERPYNCFAFTILPYDALPDKIEDDVNQALPRDLKKTRELDEQAIQWLLDPRRFHIAITINKNPTVFWNGPASVPLAIAREYVTSSLDAALRATPGTVPTDAIQRLRKLRQDAQANNFNFRLLANIWLLSVWFAVLTILLGRERDCEIVGWFPDRDNMTNYCDHIWVNLTTWNVHAFVEEFSLDMSRTHCFAAAPDRSSGKEHMWFDYMIRSADWFAGAVAAWDRKRNLIPTDHPKYRQMLEDVITPAVNMAVIHCDMDERGMQFRRIRAERKNFFMLVLTYVRNMILRLDYKFRSLFRK